jgi:hypothetical protein
MHPLGFHNLEETTAITYPYKGITNEERFEKIKEKVLLNK